MNREKSHRFLFLFAGLTALLAACAQVPEKARTGKPQTVGAGVESINYSGKEVVLMVRDPLNKNNGSGGDSLNPYSTGGTICCFSIPLVWHPGLQFIVEYQFYPDKTWHEQLVDVPPYPEGIAGRVWLAMHEDGRAEAVVSNFGPTRPEWPGRVKGRPVQSDEYALKVRDKRLERERAILKKMEKGVSENIDSLSKEKIDSYRAFIEETKTRILQLERQHP